jgi:hypothetical protein
MSKPFIIVQAYAEGPAVGQIWVRETWDDAVALVVALVEEQCDLDEEAIKKEVEEYATFVDESREWTIAIGQPED